MVLHHHDPDALGAVAVGVHALEVSVVLHVVDVVLVVPHREADRLLLAAGQPEEAQGQVAVLRAHDLDAATGGLQDRHVVDADSVAAGQARLLIRIHRPHVQAGVRAAHQLDHALGGAPGRILLLVEVRQLHVGVEAPDHPLGLGRQREGVGACHVEVNVVPVQRDVGREHEQGGGHHQAAARQPPAPARTRHRKP